MYVCVVSDHLSLPEMCVAVRRVKGVKAVPRPEAAGVEKGMVAVTRPSKSTV